MTTSTRTDDELEVDARSMSQQPQGTSLETLYVIVTGAGTARRMPEVIERLTGNFGQVIIVPTENADRIISRRELMLIPDVSVVDSYFDPAILPFPPEGVVLVAPCTFNSLNKLAAGIADTLALSIASEAIGRRTPVIVALSLNPPLYAHPRTQASVETLRGWAVEVIEPVASESWLTLAPDDQLVAAVKRARRSAGM
jgi:phosphopantothenoylcysteine synthetase/decarboxylase